MVDWIFMTVLFGYLLGTVFYLIYIIKRDDNIPKIANLIMGIAFFLHTFALIFKYFTIGRLPAMTPNEAMAFFSWAMVGTLLFMNWRFKLYILGSFVSPLAALFMLIATIIPSQTISSAPILTSTWLSLHVTSAFIGNGLFAMAFCAGIMYLIQESQIKKKRMGYLSRRLPSLSTLDRINDICLKIGFPFLTLGLITGFMYAGMVWHSYFRWDPKEVLSIVSWTIYTVLLHERITVGWQGRRPAIMAIIGFVTLLFTFLGVNYLFTGHHEF